MIQMFFPVHFCTCVHLQVSIERALSAVSHLAVDGNSEFVVVNHVTRIRESA